jgi:hypothetical protein
MISLPIYNIIKYLKGHLHKTGITLYNPATALDISFFESTNNIQLPDDIKQFYRFANGFESEKDTFRIVPLDEMTDKRDEQCLYIAEWLIYCDAWRLEINESNPNDYSISAEGGYERKTILTHSFAEFLRYFLKGGLFGEEGLYFWEDEIAKKHL